MNDSELEDLLRKHRPVGPSPGLRERILAPNHPQRWWPWAAAAAALVISALTFRVAVRQQVDDLNPQLGVVSAGDLQEDLAAMFGDDESGREVVNFLLREEAGRE
jgi:hypothetical protein